MLHQDPHWNPRAREHRSSAQDVRVSVNELVSHCRLRVRELIALRVSLPFSVQCCLEVDGVLGSQKDLDVLPRQYDGNRQALAMIPKRATLLEFLLEPIRLLHVLVHRSVTGTKCHIVGRDHPIQTEEPDGLEVPSTLLELEGPILATDHLAEASMGVLLVARPKPSACLLLESGFSFNSTSFPEIGLSIWSLLRLFPRPLAAALDAPSFAEVRRPTTLRRMPRP